MHNKDKARGRQVTECHLYNVSRIFFKDDLLSESFSTMKTNIIHLWLWLSNLTSQEVDIKHI